MELIEFEVVNRLRNLKQQCLVDEENDFND